MKKGFLRQSWTKDCRQVTKLSKKALFMECFTADFLYFSSINICLLVDHLGTRHQIQAFQGFS